MAARQFLLRAEEALSQTERQEKEWQRHFDVLPAVAEDGASSCPFAKGLYLKSYEAEYYLRQARNSMIDLLESADSHIGETTRELRQAEEDGDVSEVHRENLRIEIDRARRMVAVLHQKISFVRQSLADADRKRFPGMRRWTTAGGEA